ncbi:MAG: ATP-binding protein, partial [Gemmataceae bacterium]
MKERKFELHLPGLLKVLAEHLYSSKKVGIRELIQNAHDSCMRRRLEEKDPDYQPRITLSMQPRQRTVTIADNGSGMTEDEIVSYLATIGRGYTREMRERLASACDDDDAQLIGQFGLGFLSAFLLAEEVKVLTRSYRGGPGWQWQARGDEHYELTEAKKAAVGTSVWLRVKPAASFILQKQNLLDAVRGFADFLPVPIHWQEDAEPLNLCEFPWESDDPDEATRQFIRRVFQEKDPLLVLPLREGKFRLDHDAIRVPMNGFLFVPSNSVASVREYGDMRVYIRRMLISERQQELLPPWARFVQGVIDSPVLQPTASREDVHQDDRFEMVQQAVEEQLSAGLKQFARRDPAAWKHLVRCHSDLIVGWAIKDADFFDQV